MINILKNFNLYFYGFLIVIIVFQFIEIKKVKNDLNSIGSKIDYINKNSLKLEKDIKDLYKKYEPEDYNESKLYFDYEVIPDLFNKVKDEANNSTIKYITF